MCLQVPRTGPWPATKKSTAKGTEWDTAAPIATVTSIVHGSKCCSKGAGVLWLQRGLPRSGEPGPTAGEEAECKWAPRLSRPSVERNMPSWGWVNRGTGHVHAEQVSTRAGRGGCGKGLWWT